MVNTEVVSRIAQKIKQVRLQNGLTIQEVAQKANVSKGLLSKIENSRTIPSLPVFVGIIQALDISLKEFFEEMILLNGKDYLVVRKEEYKTVVKEDRHGFHYQHIVSQTIAACTIETVLLTIDSKNSSKPTVTDGYEFKYVISGCCDYHINEEVIELQEGDSIYFDASKPHFPKNKAKKKAVMLVVYFLMPK
jgi:transcriptional regulator with XRE-family HTH domain